MFIKTKMASIFAIFVMLLGVAGQCSTVRTSEQDISAEERQAPKTIETNDYVNATTVQHSPVQAHNQEHEGHEEGHESESEKDEGETEHHEKDHEHTMEVVAVIEDLAPVDLAAGEKLKVVATTNIIGDLVSNVGGELIDLSVLLPLGSDPHTYTPTPQDVASIADAHVVFANGLGLEAFLEELIENAGGEAAIVAISTGVETRKIGASETFEDGEKGQHHHNVDPHVWLTPAHAIVMVGNIEHALTNLDPANAATYAANSEAYEAQLQELDEWVKVQIKSIPADKRVIVTDHDSFGYYADRYGLEIVGTVLPAYSTNAEPSAQELAKVQDVVSEYGVQAIFVGTTVNPVLAKQVAVDNNIQLVPLYTDSLGEPGSGAETYIDYIRYNTRTIVEALHPKS